MRPYLGIWRGGGIGGGKGCHDLKHVVLVASMVGLLHQEHGSFDD